MLNTPDPAPSFKSPPSRPTPRPLLNFIAIFALVSASTAALMLCPCDLVSIHDRYAISLVSFAVLFAIAAAWLIYRRLRRDSGTTVFFQVFISVAIAAVALYAELFVAMEAVAWMARRR